MMKIQSFQNKQKDGFVKKPIVVLLFQEAFLTFLSHQAESRIKGFANCTSLLLYSIMFFFLFLWAKSYYSISVVSFKVMGFLGQWSFCFFQFSLGSNDNKNLLLVPRNWVTHLSRWVQYEMCLRTRDWNAESLVVLIMWLKSCSYETATEVSFKSIEFPTSACKDTFHLGRRCCIGENLWIFHCCR